ncbi:MAG: hypothetical protein ABFS86_16015 [Planctomycetota bacterium]
MIHFQCRCGTTLSAEESSAGEAVRCVSCGHEFTVPALSPAKSLRPNGRRDTGTHDFDAEISAAARSAPPRPRKTPQRVVSPEEREPSVEAGEAPAYDLIGLEAWAGRLGPLSWLFLVVFAAGAGGCFELLHGEPVLRIVVAGLLLVVGAAGCVALRVIREVCRATIGLAARQREMASGTGR